MKGSVVYLYAFDIAAEIRTSQVRELLSVKPFPFQIRVGTTVPRDVRIYQPLTIALKVEELDSNVGRVVLRPFVKVFDVGVLSISYEVPFEVKSLAELVPFHQIQIGGVSLTSTAERLCQQVAESLRPYAVKPSDERPPAEAYTAFCFSEIEGEVSAWIHAHRSEIAGLLNEEAETDKLSSLQEDETVSHTLAYTRDDGAIIDWDAALIIDREGYFDDLLYVIELANLQLEEYRLLDDRLDRLFLQAYDDLERYYRTAGLFSSRDRDLRSLRAIRMDMTKMSEEVSNITKFVGDWYLARVYLACKDRFHLGHWEVSVDQKLHEIDSLYQMVHAEVNQRRILILEIAMVALFIIDVVALFLRR
jgi:hypothetical protein